MFPPFPNNSNKRQNREASMHFLPNSYFGKSAHFNI